LFIVPNQISIKRLIFLIANYGKKGYSSIDILQTLFKVTKSMPNEDLSEFQKLEFLKEIGFCHKRALEGCTSRLQILGLISKLCNSCKKMIEG